MARSRPVVDELDAEFADSAAASATVLLVAHGGLIAGLVTGLLELPTEVWPSFGGLGNCRWAVLARREDHPRWRRAGYKSAPIRVRGVCALIWRAAVSRAG